MKNYKQLLSEETEMERRSLKSIAFKSWITPDGKAINLDNDDALYGDYHHLHKVVDSPELFGTTSDELQKLDPKTYPDLLHSSKLGYRKQNWSTPILRHLGRRGYIRTANHSFEMGGEMVHDFEVSNHGYQGKHHIQTFLPALKKVRDTIAETQISKNESISVRLYGMDGMKLRVHRRFDTLPQLDKFLTKLETTDTPRRSSDPLPVVPRHFNSTQTRQMLGRVPPPGMNIPQAIWNNMRTIGDSYVPLMTFKQNITEGTPNRRQGDLYQAYKNMLRSGVISPPTESELAVDSVEAEDTERLFHLRNRISDPRSSEDQRDFARNLHRSILSNYTDRKRGSDITVPGFNPTSEAPLKIKAVTPTSFALASTVFPNDTTLGMYMQKDRPIPGHPSRTATTEVGSSLINPFQRNEDPHGAPYIPVSTSQYVNTIAHETEHGVQFRRMKHAHAYPEITSSRPETSRDIIPAEQREAERLYTGTNDAHLRAFRNGLIKSQLNSTEATINMDMLRLRRTRPTRREWKKAYDNYLSSDAEVAARRAGAIANAAEHELNTGELISFDAFRKAFSPESDEEGGRRTPNLMTGRKSRRERLEKAIKQAYGRVAMASRAERDRQGQ